MRDEYRLVKAIEHRPDQNAVMGQPVAKGTKASKFNAERVKTEHVAKTARGSDDVTPLPT